MACILICCCLYMKIICVLMLRMPGSQKLDDLKITFQNLKKLLPQMETPVNLRNIYLSSLIFPLLFRHLKLLNEHWIIRLEIIRFSSWQVFPPVEIISVSFSKLRLLSKLDLCWKNLVASICIRQTSGEPMLKN